MLIKLNTDDEETLEVFFDVNREGEYGGLKMQIENLF